MVARRADGRDVPECCINCGGEIPVTGSKFFALQLAAPRRGEDAMIAATTAAAGRTGCAADHHAHLAGEGETAIARRAGPWRRAGDVLRRRGPGSGSGLAEETDRRDVPGAQIVQSIIEQGV